ncbi:MAG: BspA family leucine-rich repeat surface protein [Paludibacteraceae bacterium]|nr:BspA family leucine-rich repeat surface protein [Paludibacteraceae bacterium]
MKKNLLFFLALMMLTVLGVQRLAAADTPKFYAYLSSDKKTLYINYNEYYDSHPSYVTNWQNAYNADILAGITKVTIGLYVKDYNDLRSTSHWFDGFKSLKTIEGLRDYVNWTNVTDMSYMFFGCESLETIDISYMATIYVTDMSSMFSGCKALKKVYWNQPHTELVRDMSYMFDNCKALTDITCLGTAFEPNTVTVTNMTGMFSGCESLTTLDLSSFDTRNVTSMSSMFSGCSNLTEIKIDKTKFITSNVTRMHSMFSGCSKLTSMDVSGFNTANVTNLQYMFNGCSSLKTLDLSNFNTQIVTDMQYMFNGCSMLTTLDLRSFNPKKLKNTTSMFASCSRLTTIYNAINWSIGVTTSTNMFSGCTRLEGGFGTKFTSSVTNGDYASPDDGADYPGYFTYQPWDGDLSKVEHPVAATNNMVITGTLSGDHKVAVREGANVSLNNATINGSNISGSKHAGLTCLGDATITLEGSNKVRSFYVQYPGIYVPKGSTLVINGEGSLEALTKTSGAGIGGGSGIDCGNIVIAEGTIDATGGTGAAGIGGGKDAACGTVTIGICANVKAYGGAHALGAGTNGTCTGVYLLADCEAPYDNGINKGAYIEKQTFQFPSAPTGLHVVGTPGAREVTVAWTGTGIEEAWRIERSWDDDSQSSYKFCQSTTETITGLNPDTEYKVTVQADYGYSHYSDYSAPISVKTAALPPCPMPTDLKVTYPSANEVEISWTPGGEETSWWYQFYVNEQKRYEGSCYNARITVSTLQSGDQCVFKVKAICDDQGNDSEYAEIAFTFEDQTGIEEIVAPADRAAKYLLDGNLYITTPDGKIYNAQGAEVK